jgi:hypothetical protein
VILLGLVISQETGTVAAPDLEFFERPRGVFAVARGRLEKLLDDQSDQRECRQTPVEPKWWIPELASSGSIRSRSTSKAASQAGW